jgi:hypothetical protein
MRPGRGSAPAALQHVADRPQLQAAGALDLVEVSDHNGGLEKNSSQSQSDQHVHTSQSGSPRHAGPEPQPHGAACCRPPEVAAHHHMIACKMSSTASQATSDEALKLQVLRSLFIGISMNRISAHSTHVHITFCVVSSDNTECARCPATLATFAMTLQFGTVSTTSRMLCRATKWVTRI